MINRATSSGVPLSVMVVLMLSVFTVSMGYGIILPLLPYVIEQLLGASGDAGQVSRATGLLTALYTLALFLFAPAWGRLSDRYGRRAILLVGLIGFSVTMLTFAFIENLASVYAERFLGGLFSAAVIGAVAASAGILSPILTYWISSKAGRAQGAELGKQTAASSLGVTVGSAAGGLLFDVTWLPNASFLLMTLLTGFALLLSLGLPNMLVSRMVGEDSGDRRVPKPPTYAATGRPTA